MTPSTLRLLRPKLLHPEIQLYINAKNQIIKLVVSATEMKNSRKCIIANLEFMVQLYGCKLAADLCQQIVQIDLTD